MSNKRYILLFIIYLFTNSLYQRLRIKEGFIVLKENRNIKIFEMY